MVPEQIEREVVIQASPERVWAVLTEPGHVDRWFTNAGADLDLRPGGSIRDLDLPESEQAQHVKDNTEGWHGGLAAAKAYLEGSTA